MKPRAGIPPVPPPGCDFMTAAEGAGYLRVTPKYFCAMRRDPEFPLPHLLSEDRTPRWDRADLAAYVRARPRGWTKAGGIRRGAFGREEAAPAT